MRIWLKQEIWVHVVADAKSDVTTLGKETGVTERGYCAKEAVEEKVRVACFVRPITFLVRP